MVKLATGQQMAAFLKNKGVTLTKLTTPQIRNGLNGATLEGLTQAQRTALLADTPLWFYILREAELNQGRLRRRRADRGGDLPPSDGGQQDLDRSRARLAPDARSRQHHVPHGRPAAVRVRGEEEPAGSGDVGRLVASGRVAEGAQHGGKDGTDASRIHAEVIGSGIATNSAFGISEAARRASSKKSASSSAAQMRHRRLHVPRSSATAPSAVAASHAARIASASDAR